MVDEKIIVRVAAELEGLIPGFLENRKADIDKLRTASDNGDFEVLCSIGHSIKGVGGGYGFDLMSEIGASIEIAAKENNADLIKQKIEQLDDYLGRIEVDYSEL